MASAQVLPNSRKLGHLEAGKKKLEEFRKKKAEGRAKKAASTGQLMSSVADQDEKLPQRYEDVREGSKSANDPHGLDTADENKAVNSSQRTSIYSTNRIHGSPSVLADSNHASYGESVQDAGKEVPNLSRTADFPELVNGYYDQSKGSNDLNHNEDANFRPPGSVSGRDQFDTSDPAKINPHLDMHINNSHNAPPDEDRNLSKVNMTHPQTPFVNSWSAIEQREKVSWQDRLGHPNTSANTAGLHKESAVGVRLSHPGNLYENNASIFHNLNVESASWHASEPSYNDSSMPYKGLQYEYPLASTGLGISSGRSRPSFLDSLGVSKVSSAVHVPYGEPDKTNIPVPLENLKVQSTVIPSLHSSVQTYTELNTADQPFKLMTSDSTRERDSSLNTLVSSNDEKLLNSVGDHHGKRDHEFTSKKDEDFSALEQHIEDLTQEKFSLQRALETSRTLAESLAAENSSLTESYNQQGQTVSQLKSDMERMQEEIKAQLLALESLRSDYMNAQLECHAADERSKILASEVIGLEEKALRLRSNELKLEKQLEDMKSEISSYKRKVSILEKERQDFQSTIDALQEEKKLLHSKLRKVSTNEKVNVKTTSTKRDACTSTEDLGAEPLNFVDDERRITDRRLNSTINLVQDNATIILPTDAVDFSSLVPESVALVLPDTSIEIPHDQRRMIENINSLISELALEKEELVGALRIESSNCAKMKDLNKDLLQKLEAQTQRLELLTAQRMANENSLARPMEMHRMQDATEYADEGDEVVERVLGWIMKLFPGGPSKRRTSKLL